MASYCSKCGSEIPAGNRFCTKCGAPIAAATVPPPQPMSAPQAMGAPQPMAAPPQMGGPQQMAVPAKSGSSALKIVLIIVAVFVGLGIIGMGVVGYTAWRISRAVHVNSSSGEVTLHTPEGTLSASTKQNFTASDLGIDIYPGAAAAEGGMRMTVPDGTMVTGVYATPDAEEQVVTFYKGKAGSNASVMETGEGALITVKASDKESIVITVTPNSEKDGGKTRIQIVHTVSTKAA